jgi:hypothetical protein
MEIMTYSLRDDDRVIRDVIRVASRWKNGVRCKMTSLGCIIFFYKFFVAFRTPRVRQNTYISIGVDD